MITHRRSRMVGFPTAFSGSGPASEMIVDIVPFCFFEHKLPTLERRLFDILCVQRI